MRRPLASSSFIPAALLLAALLPPGCSHDAKDKKEPIARHVPAPPPGKLETIERREYPVPEQEGEPEPQPGPAAEGGESDVIRIEGESAGTPGLVLTRAMSGAQALGYTLLELEDRDLFFVAEKRPSLIGTVIGGATGICRIVVGVAKEPASGAVKVTLKGRSGTPTGRTACERDLRKVLEYAKGESIVKPKKPSAFDRFEDAYPARH
jgi:hypothetical protein